MHYHCTAGTHGDHHRPLASRFDSLGLLIAAAVLLPAVASAADWWTTEPGARNWREPVASVAALPTCNTAATDTLRWAISENATYRCDGASYSLTTLAGAGGIADDAELVGALGSATNDAADETLTSTEADVIASTPGTLTAGAGALAKHASLVATAFDGHSTAIDLFLNLSVPDAGSTDSENDTVSVSGTVTLDFVLIADY